MSNKNAKKSPNQSKELLNMEKKSDRSNGLIITKKPTQPKRPKVSEIDPNSTTTTTTTSIKPVISKPQTNELLSRAKSFLEQMKQANQQLEQEIQQNPELAKKKYQIEVIEVESNNNNNDDNNNNNENSENSDSDLYDSSENEDENNEMMENDDQRDEEMSEGGQMIEMNLAMGIMEEEKELTTNTIKLPSLSEKPSKRK